MNDSDFQATSKEQMDAVGQAMTDDAYTAAQDRAIYIRNFGFRADMLPGWTFSRAREIDTGRGVRLVQANAQTADGQGMARIEILETADAGEGRALFMETLARFQRDPSSILRVPPRFGEAEAAPAAGTFVYLRGNLVVTVTSIGAQALVAEEVAEALDNAVCEKPAGAETAPADAEQDGRPMIKTFVQRDRRGGESSEAFVIAPDGSARRMSDAGDPDSGSS